MFSVFFWIQHVVTGKQTTNKDKLIKQFNQSVYFNLYFVVRTHQPFKLNKRHLLFQLQKSSIVDIVKTRNANQLIQH